MKLSRKTAKAPRLFVLIVIVTFCGLWGYTALATEIIYTPVNPSFGGSPLNSSHLLNSANAQNEFQDDELDAIEEFEDQLRRRLLSEISRKITTDTFGDEGLTAGTYTIGDYSIDVDTGSTDGIIVEIQDFSTGGTTTIEIPRF